MLNALRSAATGMEAQQIRIDGIANDLANVNTTGYKKAKADFEDLYYDQIKTPGALEDQNTASPTGIQVGHGTKLTAIAKVFTNGELQQTQQQLDLAISGNGFFTVTDSSGNTYYTRNGTFMVNKDGLLSTTTGMTLDPQISIPTTATSLTIADDGTVSTSASGETTATTLGQITLAMIPNPAGLKYLGSNNYQVTDASGAATAVTPGAEGSGKIMQGFLESSNVNVGESLINMIVAQRSYEANAKVIETADRMMQSVNNIT